MTRLVKKYQDPAEPGLIVYLNLHHDLVAVGDNMAAEQLNLNETAANTDYVPSDVSSVETQKIYNLSDSCKHEYECKHLVSIL